MNESPKNEPDDDPTRDWMSDQEFVEWVKNPENKKRLLEEMKNVAGGEYGPLTPEIMKSANDALKRERDAQAIEVLSQKFEELASLVHRPGMSAQHRQFLERGIDELTDLLLETGEPYRTRFLKQLIPLREEVKRMNGKKL